MKGWKKVKIKKRKYSFDVGLFSLFLFADFILTFVNILVGSVINYSFSLPTVEDNFLLLITPQIMWIISVICIGIFV